MKMAEEMEALKGMLEVAGVAYEEHNPYISFSNGNGECWVFPSQTYDGKLAVQYVGRARVHTAKEALRLCGVVR